MGFEKCLSSVQLTPPHEAEVLQTTETFNITWKSGYEDHEYLAGILDYELLLQTSQSTDSKVRSVPYSHTWTSFAIKKQQQWFICLFFFPSSFPQTLQPNSHENSVSVQRSQLKPDATYCIKVRSIPGHPEYQGTWSKWSPSTCWKSEAGEGKEPLFPQY